MWMFRCKIKKGMQARRVATRELLQRSAKSRSLFFFFWNSLAFRELTREGSTYVGNDVLVAVLVHLLAQHLLGGILADDSSHGGLLAWRDEIRIRVGEKRS